MREFVQWIGGYPIWLRIGFYILLGICIELLVAFGRGEAPSRPATEPRSITNSVGNSPTSSRSPESAGSVNHLPESKQKEEALAPSAVTPARPALPVSFADGRRGRVEVSVQAQVPPDKAPWLVANFGNLQAAQDQFMTHFSGQVRSELAKYTMDQVQKERDAIQAALLASARKLAESTFGFTVHNVTLGEIRPAE